MSAHLFSETYLQARNRFRDAALDAGGQLTSYLHPLTGAQGEPLALDLAQFGNPKAPDVLFTLSGTHGIEGYCGSGSQMALLQDAALQAAVATGRLRMIHLHALNPHGYSHGRRVNEDNIDLNRNFVDFRQPLPKAPAHGQLLAALLPAAWPPSAEDEAVLAAYALEHGAMGLQQAISGGQYEYPQSLFYGGKAVSWSNRTLRRILTGIKPHCQRFFWIDFHTGLGPIGHGERIYAGRNDPVELAFHRAVFGDGITSFYDGSSTSAALTGINAAAAFDALPQAQVACIALEYGTLPQERVSFALRADHWLALHPEASPALAGAIRQAMRAAFYVETPAWKEAIVRQSLAAAHDVLRFLGH